MEKLDLKKGLKPAEMLREDNQLKYALDLLKSWQVFDKHKNPT